MRKMLLILFLLNSLHLQAADSQQIVAGQQYPGGSQVSSAQSGISFQIPTQWLGGLPVGGAAFILGSNTQPGMGLVIMRGQGRMQDIQGLLASEQDLGSGVVLYPSGIPRIEGQRMTAEYSNGLYYGYAIGELSDAGNGLVIFFAGPQDQARTYQSLSEDVLKSVRYSKPQISPLVQQWKQQLSGMMLKRLSSYYSGGGVDGSYVGGSSSQTLHLCSNGQYAYAYSSDFSVDGGNTGGYSAGGYGSSGDEDQGQWDVESLGTQVTLVLRSQDGSQSMHSLSMQNEETMVDGERAYRVQSDRCR